MVDVEQHFILKVIKRGREMRTAVDFGIPYARLLQHLRFLINRGYLLRSDGEVTVTALGDAAIASSPASSASSRGTRDPLAEARREPVSPNVVLIPDETVR